MRNPLFLNLHDGAIGLYGLYFAACYIRKYQRGYLICNKNHAGLARNLLSNRELDAFVEFRDCSTKFNKMLAHKKAIYLAIWARYFIHDLQGTLSSIGWVFWPFFRILGGLVITEHEPNPLSHVRPWYFGFLVAMRRIFPNQIVVLGNATYTSLAESIKNERILAVEHGPFSHYKTPCIQHSKRILFLGKFRESKGFDRIPEIAHQIYLLDPDVTIHVTGAYPRFVNKVDSVKWKRKLTECVIALEKAPNVELVVGDLSEEDVAKAICSSTLLVLAYRTASNSGVLAAAVGCGRAVVVTDVGELSRVVTLGEFGVVCNQNCSEIALQAYKLIQDNSRRKAMEENALNFAEGGGSWTCSVSKYERRVLKVFS